MIRSDIKLRIGSDYGGWTIPHGLLSEASVCYCAGCGQDISFDLGLIEQYKCTVFGFDPTPASIAYVRELVRPIRNYRFLPIGIWNKEAVVKFYAPADFTHVSHSLINIQHTTGYFEASTARVSKVMRDHEHRAISLLKLDIEGAECDVIDSILDEGIRVPILAVEFDELNFEDRASIPRIRDTVRRLMDGGYDLFHIESANFTFVLHGLLRSDHMGQ